MKKYIVTYEYNNFMITSTMQVYANNEYEAAYKCFGYAGVDSVIDVKEVD